MRIAICDDESTHRTSLMDALLSSETMPKDATISEYPGGTELMDAHMRCPHDVIFLDIEMEGISGLEAGQQIRNTDRNAIIIFLTSFDKYVFKSFRVEPFEYIIKPVDNWRISEVLGRAVRKHREQYFIVDFKWKDKPYALRVCDIVFLESDMRHVIFVTNDNRYKCVGRLDEYERRLSPYGFLRCHQSYLINMSYIKSIEKKSIVTSLGYEIAMSIRRKQYCLGIFHEFITKYRV